MPNEWLGFFLLTLFNAAACLLLPRLAATNWSQVFERSLLRASAAESVETHTLSNRAIKS
ncbi:MAG: hypothetical protein J7641_23200 [Cyanobacteria bacterium SID2]|nr:hypothetical protein [Cyanobacteria bacterium SID2]MBP0005954.1 hypothetical protein [Cyanobacteria bacterium SBC]